MRASTVLASSAAAGGVLAQRPSDTPVCDYYTTASLKNNTAENQYTLSTSLVNTAVIGNYTQPNVGVSVPGISAPGTYNGTEVNSLPYFDGMLASSNRGGDSGVAINFLDGGAAAPIMNNMPANSTTSNQYLSLTHLYQYFGYSLGCTKYSTPGFPAYAGHASMYEVHKFMDSSAAEVGYFIQQVGSSAASFGVATDDIMAVGTALNSLFGYRCAPAMTVIPAQGAVLESICIDESCPIAPNATCSMYNATMMPQNATAASGSMSNGTMTSGSNGSMASASATMPAQYTGAASVFGIQAGVVGLAAAAFAFLL